MLPLLRTRIFYVLLGIAGTAGGICYWQWDVLRDNAITSSAVAGVTALLAFLGVLLREIGQDLKKSWTPAIVDWADAQVKLLLSGFRRRYYRQLLYRHLLVNFRSF